MMLRTLILLAVLTFAVPAHATIWDVDYLTRGDIGQANQFYPDGTYELLLGAGYVTVYLFDSPTRLLGLYGEVSLPPDFPVINFPTGRDQAIVRIVTTQTLPGPTAVPEADTLPMLVMGLVSVYVLAYVCVLRRRTT